MQWEEKNIPGRMLGILKKDGTINTGCSATYEHL